MRCNDCSTYMSPHEGSPDKSDTSNRLLNELDHRIFVYIKSRIKSHKIIINKGGGEYCASFHIYFIIRLVFILNNFLKLAVACFVFSDLRNYPIRQDRDGIIPSV